MERKMNIPAEGKVGKLKIQLERKYIEAKNAQENITKNEQ